MTVRALSQALLMSTSSPLKQDNGVEYSPRKQGSGFANVYHAVTTPAYLLTDSKDVTDGKVKVNLGDDPDRTGEYTFDFTINNLLGQGPCLCAPCRHQHHGGRGDRG